MSEHPSKSWQSRIAGETTDKFAQEFVESISYDKRLYKHDIAGSIAHATMLAKVGLISDPERDQIIEGLRSIERDIESGNFVFDQSLEDIHMVIEDALIKRVGEAGKKLHTGRSRNDQVATDLMLWMRDTAESECDGALVNVRRAFVSLAERSRDIVMPSYTHLQRAQPICAGAEALAWAQMFDQDSVRLIRSGLGVFAEAPQSPLGSGAIAGTSLPIDPQFTAKMFKAMQAPTNSIERTASRDQVLDFVFALSMIAMHLSRWAEQWIIYSSTEFGFIRIADRYTTGSSMMPQKRNPDMLELIRGRCGSVYGNLFALLTILKGLPIGYNRDLQEDKRHVFAAYDTVSSCLKMATAIVNSAEFVKENIEPTLEKGFLDATSLAEYLVMKGIPFRTAHQIVGSLVRKCEETGRHALKQLNVEEINQAIEEGTKARRHEGTKGGRDEETERRRDEVRVTDEVYDVLGAHNVVKRYQSAGAAGGKPFEEQLRAWKERLGISLSGRGSG